MTQKHKREPQWGGEGKVRNHQCQWDISSGDHEHSVLIHLVEVETQPAGGATGNIIYLHSVSSRDPQCLQPMFTAINPVKDESLWFGWRYLKEVSFRKGCSPSSCSRSSTCDTPWSPPQSFSSSSCPPVQSPVDRMQNYQTWNFWHEVNHVPHLQHKIQKLKVSMFYWLSTKLGTCSRKKPQFYLQHLDSIKIQTDFKSNLPQASDVNLPPSPPGAWQTHTLGSSSSPHLNTAAKST